MGQFVVGDVVIIGFPFSDLSNRKRRPSLVLAEVEFSNLVLCQITSKPYSSKAAIVIDGHMFIEGGLPITSYVRPDKLFTAELGIIEGLAGKLQPDITERILAKVRKLFTPT